MLKNNFIAQFLCIFTVIVTVLLLNPTRIYAQEKIIQFDSQIKIQKDGNLDVIETINYDFGQSFRHGIFRYIPTVHKVSGLYKNLKIYPKNVYIDGKSELFEASDEVNFISFIDSSQLDQNRHILKIGDPDKTITGLHTYQITYTVVNAVTNFNDHDELFWNVTGNGWQIPIDQVSAKITSESTQIIQIKCFTGSFGSKAQDCMLTNFQKNATFDTTNLGIGEGLSIVAGFPANTFPKTKLYKLPLDIPTWVFIVLGIGLLAYYIVLPGYILFWYLLHKRKNRFGKPVVNFDFPKGNKGKRIAPAEAGTIDTAKLEKDDITATIFDLAIRKYIILKEAEGKKMIGIVLKEKEYLIEKTTKDSSDLNLYEKQLYDRLFKDVDSVKVEDLSKDFYVTFNAMQDLVFGYLVSRGFYVKNPANQRTTFFVLGLFSLATLNIFLGVLMLVFARVMNGRTKLGDEMDWKIDGLKIFLKNMTREYKFQVKNLVTVEKYIPYAIALGYIDEFMKQLKEVYPDYNPSWYNGQTGSYNFYNFYPAFLSSVSSNATTSAPSSSSGFSGGGSSGGGGGGGGGGSW